MDYREQQFRMKFEHAAEQLGTAPHQIVSIKLRDNGGDYQEYKELFTTLTHEAGLKATPASGNLQGNGRLIENAKTKVIVVEHETGLEILYIAGSIASLIGLIPVVLKCWSGIRGRFGRPHHMAPDRVEVRRLSEDGKLVEEPSHVWNSHWGGSFSAVDDAILMAAERIDSELDTMRQSLESLAARVDTLEGKSSATKSTRKLTTRKRRPKAH